MSKFDLIVRDFKVPEFPHHQAGDHLPHPIRLSMVGSFVACTTPLIITVSLPSAREKDPLYPASRLQLVYSYKGTGDRFIPNFITSGDLVRSDAEENLYTIEVHPDDISRVKVNVGGTTTAEVVLYAWRGEKLLGKWIAGKIEGLGIVGYKTRVSTVAESES